VTASEEVAAAAGEKVLQYGAAAQIQRRPSRMMTGSMAQAYDEVPVRVHAIDATAGDVPGEAVCGWPVATIHADLGKDWFTVAIQARCSQCAQVLGVATGAEK
jgi:hypothetical protein